MAVCCLLLALNHYATCSCHASTVFAGVAFIQQCSAGLPQDTVKSMWQQAIKAGACSYSADPYFRLCYAAALTGRGLCPTPTAASDSHAHRPTDTPTDRITVSSTCPTAQITSYWKIKTPHEAKEASKGKRCWHEEWRQRWYCTESSVTQSSTGSHLEANQQFGGRPGAKQSRDCWQDCKW